MATDPGDPKVLPSIDLSMDGAVERHVFVAAEVKELAADYLTACMQHRIVPARIIQGTGPGKLRRIVHGVRQHPHVPHRALADRIGDAGAAVVQLRVQGS